MQVLKSGDKLPSRKGYFIHTWWEETSRFDPNGIWQPGIEIYERECQMFVPCALGKNQARIDAYVERHLEDDDSWVVQKKEGSL